MMKIKLMNFKMCLNTSVDVQYFILVKTKLIIHQQSEKTSIDPKTYKLHCNLRSFLERDLRIRDTLSRMLSRNLLLATEAKLLSIDAFVP